MIDISIIIPVYNAEMYIYKCLDSIYNQDFNGSFEVIAVNDASSDNSLEKLKIYQNDKQNFKIINHKTNLKLSKSRLDGMLIANGNYIMHIDADDWIEKDSLQVLKDCIDKNNPDVIVYNYVKEYETGTRIYPDGIKKEYHTQDKLSVVDFFLRTAVNKLVKRDLTFDLIGSKVSVNHSEDLLYSLEILLKVKDIYMLKETLYVYFHNSNSITQNFKNKSFLESQILVFYILNQLNSSFDFKYHKILSPVKKYYLKYVYLSLCQIHFFEKIDNIFINSFYKKLNFENKSELLTKNDIKRIKISIKNKWINLIEVSLRFGIKPALFIISKKIVK